MAVPSSARPPNGLGVATFDNCIAKAGNRTAVSNCISRLANDIRP
jgi:hypothetical protein